MSKTYYFISPASSSTIQSIQDQQIRSYLQRGQASDSVQPDEIEEWYQAMRPYAILKNLKMQYQIGELLGRGNFANVYEGISFSDQQRYAIKSIDKKMIMTAQRNLTALYNEITLVRKIEDHSHVIKMHEVFESENNIHLVLEKLHGKELFEKIKQQGFFNESDASVIMRCILKGLVAVHSKGIVHRDLKPENILFGDTNSLESIKIVDFGLSTDTEGELLYMKCGSPGYVAPEILNDSGYDCKADVFSAGVILYIMLTGKFMFAGKNYREILAKNKDCDIPYPNQIWDYKSPAIKDFLKKLLAKDPQNRLSSQEALCHPWLWNGSPPKTLAIQDSSQNKHRRGQSITQTAHAQDQSFPQSMMEEGLDLKQSNLDDEDVNVTSSEDDDGQEIHSSNLNHQIMSQLKKKEDLSSSPLWNVRKMYEDRDKPDMAPEIRKLSTYNTPLPQSRGKIQSFSNYNMSIGASPQNPERVLLGGGIIMMNLASANQTVGDNRVGTQRFFFPQSTHSPTNLNHNLNQTYQQSPRIIQTSSPKQQLSPRIAPALRQMQQSPSNLNGKAGQQSQSVMHPLYNKRESQDQNIHYENKNRNLQTLNQAFSNLQQASQEKDYISGMATKKASLNDEDFQDEIDDLDEVPDEDDQSNYEKANTVGYLSLAAVQNNLPSLISHKEVNKLSFINSKKYGGSNEVHKVSDNLIANFHTHSNSSVMTRHNLMSLPSEGVGFCGVGKEAQAHKSSSGGSVGGNAQKAVNLTKGQQSVHPFNGYEESKAPQSLKKSDQLISNSSNGSKHALLNRKGADYIGSSSVPQQIDFQSAIEKPKYDPAFIHTNESDENAVVAPIKNFQVPTTPVSMYGGSRNLMGNKKGRDPRATVTIQESLDEELNSQFEDGNFSHSNKSQLEKLSIHDNNHPKLSDQHATSNSNLDFSGVVQKRVIPQNFKNDLSFQSVDLNLQFGMGTSQRNVLLQQLEYNSKISNQQLGCSPKVIYSNGQSQLSRGKAFEEDTFHKKALQSGSIEENKSLKQKSSPTNGAPPIHPVSKLGFQSQDFKQSQNLQLKGEASPMNAASFSSKNPTRTTTTDRSSHQISTSGIRMRTGQPDTQFKTEEFGEQLQGFVQGLDGHYGDCQEPIQLTDPGTAKFNDYLMDDYQIIQEDSDENGEESKEAPEMIQNKLIILGQIDPEMQKPQEPEGVPSEFDEGQNASSFHTAYHSFNNIGSSSGPNQQQFMNIANNRSVKDIPSWGLSDNNSKYSYNAQNQSLLRTHGVPGSLHIGSHIQKLRESGDFGQMKNIGSAGARAGMSGFCNLMNNTSSDESAQGIQKALLKHLRTDNPSFGGGSHDVRGEQQKDEEQQFSIADIAFQDPQHNSAQGEQLRKAFHD